MNFVEILKEPTQLVGLKIGGFTVTDWLDSKEESIWFKAIDDNSKKFILYLYGGKDKRDKERSKIYGLISSSHGSVSVGNKVCELFWYIGTYRVMMTCQQRLFFANDKTRPKKIKDYEVIAILGYGYKGITFKVKKGVSLFALKIVNAEEYADESYLKEFARVNALAEIDRDHFLKIDDYDFCDLEIDGNKEKFFYSTQECIKGPSLEEYLKDSKCISVSFLQGYIKNMLDALSVMYDEDLMHDDLHSNNVLIYTSPNSQPRPILIDFGSVKNKGNTKKERDDIRNFATHIALIRNVILVKSEAKSHEEDLIIKACESLHAVISDDDPLRRPENPKEIYQNYQNNFPRSSTQQKLKHPFDFGNSEEVLDNRLLHSLAAETFPWKERIEDSSNLLVIGPRGCGKTTIFRSMSFVCLADADKLQDALGRTYIGLYISCNKDFRQRFSSLDEEILKSRGNEIRHYFNLLVLREYIGTVKACEKKAKLLDRDLNIFLEFIEAKLGWRILKSFQAGESFLAEIEGMTIREIDLTRNSISNNYPLPKTTHQSFISDLVILSREKISPFLGKEFYLFIDDYTERKVPKEIQRVLNHILFVPNGDFKTKISSEVFGVIPDQTFGSFIDQDRDYKELNLGTLYYANLPDKDQKSFLKEIVDTRLKLCQYNGAVDGVIGQSEYPEGTLARSIKVEHELRKQNKESAPALRDSEIEEKIHSENKKAYYHGWDTICDLCTGDIGNILELLNRMYRDNNIEVGHTKIIPPYNQDKSIQLYSNQLISKIKGIPQFGDKLFEIVNSFGSYSSEILREHPWVYRKGERKDPQQTIRIELDEGYIRKNDSIKFLHEEEVAGADNDVDEPAILWMLLQRYSIFIDAEESRSRRNTLASKVILRRIFCPAFKISLSNSESLTIDGPNWRAFCIDPQSQGKILAKRKIKDATENKNQIMLSFED